MPSQYNPDKHHRRSIRLQGYDYASAGSYFITLCTHQRQCLFGEIVDGQMRLNEFGQIAADTYLWLATQYPYIHLDSWVVMPNHLHGIIVMADYPCKGDSRIAPAVNGAPRKSLGRLIGAFKTVSTKQINLIRNTPGMPLWQRNYYEHIIRDDRALQNIRRYIQNNPSAWQEDKLYAKRTSKPSVQS